MQILNECKYCKDLCSCFYIVLCDRFGIVIVMKWGGGRLPVEQEEEEWSPSSWTHCHCSLCMPGKHTYISIWLIKLDEMLFNVIRTMNRRRQATEKIKSCLSSKIINHLRYIIRHTDIHLAKRLEDFSLA